MIQKLKNIFHFLEAVTANIYFGFPSKKLKVIGVTGTDGKTTTIHCIHHILKKSGYPTSMISSIYANIGGKSYDVGLHVTTPRSFAIQKYLKEAVGRNSKYFVLETTSHGLDQNRVWGVRYEVGILTNISREHLYHHASMDNYVRIKTKLLLQSETPILNKSDKNSAKAVEILKLNSKQYKTFSLFDKSADYIWDKSFQTSILQSYNRENILAAAACCFELGLDREAILKAIRSFSLPTGRLDVVYDSKFKVVIDFAHTPNSINRLLRAVKKSMVSNKRGRLIHVFGAASERDDTKRPAMGSSSGKYSDIVVLTEEDYRNEDIEKIWKQIETGLINAGFIEINTKQKINNSKKVYAKIKNRKEAISYAIGLARDGDIVICTGKSHEKSLNREGREYPWNEYTAVKKALLKKGV